MNKIAVSEGSEMERSRAEALLYPVHFKTNTTETLLEWCKQNNVSHIDFLSEWMCFLYIDGWEYVASISGSERHLREWHIAPLPLNPIQYTINEFGFCKNGRPITDYQHHINDEFQSGFRDKQAKSYRQSLDNWGF